MRTAVLKILFYLSLYRIIFLPTIILTIVCGFLFHTWGAGILPVLTWFKIITSTILVLYALRRGRKQMYLYYNAGIRKTHIITSAIIIDALLYIIIV